MSVPAVVKSARSLRDFMTVAGLLLFAKVAWPALPGGAAGAIVLIALMVGYVGIKMVWYEPSDIKYGLALNEIESLKAIGKILDKRLADTYRKLYEAERENKSLRKALGEAPYRRALPPAPAPKCPEPMTAAERIAAFVGDEDVATLTVGPVTVAIIPPAKQPD